MTTRQPATIVKRPEPDVREPDIRSAALAWARADRDADARTHELHSIERIVAMTDRPLPADLIAARARASDALADACRMEGAAEAVLKDVARNLLDGEHASSEASGPGLDDQLEAERQKNDRLQRDLETARIEIRSLRLLERNLFPG